MVAVARAGGSAAARALAVPHDARLGKLAQPAGQHARRDAARALLEFAEAALTLRQREIVIDRTAARCGAGCERAIHAATFGAKAGLDAAQLRSLASGDASDECWDEPDRAVIAAVDALHDSNDLSDGQWDALVRAAGEDGAIDLMLVCSLCRPGDYAGVEAATAGGGEIANLRTGIIRGRRGGAVSRRKAPGRAPASGKTSARSLSPLSQRTLGKLWPRLSRAGIGPDARMARKDWAVCASGPGTVGVPALPMDAGSAWSGAMRIMPGPASASWLSEQPRCMRRRCGAA